MTLENNATTEQYLAAITLINTWATEYYDNDNQIATDEEYDKLYFEIVDFEKENESDISEESPTQRVGGVTGSEDKVKREHKKKMYSLDDTFSDEEVREWAASHPKGTVYEEEPKFDGASCNMLFEKGKLVSATSRGDGYIGEDLTSQMQYIAGVPLTIPYEGTIEIRGEVVIMKADFEGINVERVAAGDKAFKNERNAAAGALRNEDPVKVQMAKLHFVPYGVGYADMTWELQTEQYQFIMDQGFQNWGTIETAQTYTDIEDIIALYHKMVENRDNYPMLLDGMVIKINSISQQEDLGETNKYPRWATAFKFPALEKVTKIEDIILQVGKTGAITPVAVITPTELDGATVSRATLHNFSEIETKDLRIGDSVVIIRSGDVIPKILYSFPDRRDGTEIVIEVPTECPTCGSATKRDKKFNSEEDATVIKCSNRVCPDIIKQRFAYAVGKKALDIGGLSISAINDLVESGLVVELVDLWSVTTEQFLTLEGFKERKAQKMVDAIAKVVGQKDIYRLLNAIDIESIGETASKKLAAEFGARIFDPVNNPISFDELVAVEDIGEAMATKYVEFFEVEANREATVKVFETLKPVVPEKLEIVESGLTGKTIVVTGTLSQSRGFYEDIIEKAGGKAGKSVSKKTDYLLAGDKAGSKLEKATTLGVTVLTEEEFMAMS